jgi:hypothetical protein
MLMMEKKNEQGSKMSDMSHDCDYDVNINDSFAAEI